ncbi:hypothetical protein DV515_00005932 [Chloebia gouldiae]|uniref:Uncharacterized protein n=1 Tax=Chloebia gouldiae TaxID=44316 RepID=A0A3L8SLH4_CHLGU|nr:hypothetical protein DV515_00005932 [Chloebia gouldiae]
MRLRHSRGPRGCSFLCLPSRSCSASGKEPRASPEQQQRNPESRGTAGSKMFTGMTLATCSVQGDHDAQGTSFCKNLQISPLLNYKNNSTFSFLKTASPFPHAIFSSSYSYPNSQAVAGSHCQERTVVMKDTAPVKMDENFYCGLYDTIGCIGKVEWVSWEDTKPLGEIFHD